MGKDLGELESVYILKTNFDPRDETTNRFVVPQWLTTT